MQEFMHNVENYLVWQTPDHWVYRYKIEIFTNWFIIWLLTSWRWADNFKGFFFKIHVPAYFQHYRYSLHQSEYFFYFHLSSITKLEQFIMKGYKICEWVTLQFSKLLFKPVFYDVASRSAKRFQNIKWMNWCKKTKNTLRLLINEEIQKCSSALIDPQEFTFTGIQVSLSLPAEVNLFSGKVKRKILPLTTNDNWTAEK